MTLLGVPATFQMGVTSSASGMNLSLDDMIKQRAKSNVSDRAAGARTARSTAKRNARRGIATSNKPTEQQVAKEVQIQSHKTATKQLTAQQKNVNAKKGRNNNTSMDVEQPELKKKSLKEKVALKKQQREVQAIEKNIQSTGGKIRIPSRRMIEAAKSAMANLGYEFPPNTTLHVVATGKSTSTAAPNNKKSIPTPTTILLPQQQASTAAPSTGTRSLGRRTNNNRRSKPN